jgi:hypothetical protein
MRVSIKRALTPRVSSWRVYRLPIGSEVLTAALPERAVLQRALNTLLRRQVHHSLLQGKRSYCLALDITLIPYHGQVAPDDPTVVRAKAKTGTNQFHGYATVSIVHHQCRHVLALWLVQPHESMVSIVRDLLDRVRRLNIRVRRVYFDKEFYAVEVFRTLNRRHLAYVIPVPVKRNKTGKPTALQALCHGRRSYATTYTLHPTHGRRCAVALVLAKRNRRRKQQKVVRWFVYAVAGLPAGITHPVYLRCIVSVLALRPVIGNCIKCGHARVRTIQPSDYFSWAWH